MEANKIQPVYNRKSTEIIHRIVEEYYSISKKEMMQLLNVLRNCIVLEVYHPLTKAMRESKQINKIDFDNYLQFKKKLSEYNASDLIEK